MKAIRLVTVLTALVLAGCGDGSVQSPDFTPQIQSLEVTPATGTVANGQTFEFTAMGTFSVPPGSDEIGETRDVSSDVEWESSNSAVATIDGDGVATGVGEGTTTITASKDGKTDTAVLTVGPGVLEGLAIVPANPTVPVGGLQALTALGIYSDDRDTPRPLPPGTEVTWTSSAEAVATVAPTTGNPTTVTGVTNGTSTITATSGEFDGTTVVTVGGFPIPDGGLTRIAPANPTVPVGATLELTAFGLFGGVEKPVDDSLINWTSATTAVATIDANGVATGIVVGASQITAALKDGVVITTGARQVTTTLTVVDGIFALCTTPLLDPDATATKATIGLLDLGGSVPDPEKVTDPEPLNFATVSTVAGAATGGSGVRVDARGPTYSVPFAGGRSPGFIIGRAAGTLAEVDLFQQIEVSTLLNGAIQETTGDTEALRLGLFGVQAVGSNDLRLVTIPASLPFDGIRVILKNRTLGVLTNLQVYRACAATKLPPVIASTLQSVLRVEPVDESLEKGATVEYRAIGRYPDGDDSNTTPDELQIPDDQLDWTVTPGGGTIDQDGVLTGGTAGAATVTATLKSAAAPAATPRTASASLTVTAELCATRFLAPDYEATSVVSGPVCTGANTCRASGLANVTDAPKVNHADIDIVAGVGLLGDGVAVTVAPRSGVTVTPQLAGGQPGFVIGREPGGTALLSLLGQFTLQTLLNGTVQQTSSVLNPLELDLVGMVLIGNSEANVVRFTAPTTLPYDSLRLTVSPIVGLLTNVHVFGACATTP